MAKQKKKKKRKAIMPPLSTLDKFIYYALIFISILFCVGLGTLFIIIRNHIAYTDTTVVANYFTFSVMLFSPLILFIIIFCFTIISIHLTIRTPIFGKKGVKYGPPLYDSKYPVFMKNKPCVYMKPSEKQLQKRYCIMIFIILVITLILCAFSFCGRKCLTNDVTLQQYNIINIKTSEYTVDEIESSTFRVYHHVGYKYSSGHWSMCVEFTTEDNKVFEFSLGDFKPSGKSATTDKLNILLNIKSQLNPDDINYIGVENIENLIGEISHNEKEIKMLYELFNIN